MKMSKQFKGFRLKKRDIEYIDQLVDHNNFNSQTEVMEYLIDYYRSEKGIEIQLKKDLAKWFENAYYKLIPFLFGSLFAYFFILRKWFFLPFLIMALIPIFIKIEAIQPNILRLKT